MLPGFSAGASLYRSRNVYAEFGPHSGAGGLLPAAVEPCLGAQGGIWGFDISSGDGADMAPSQRPLNPPICEPDCGACKPDARFASGCSMYCLHTNCSHSYVECTGCNNPCPGGTLCNGVCKHTKWDPANCGACGHVCLPGESCVNGTCVCPSPNVICNGVCTNLQTDSKNCGSCGTACPGADTCCNGNCAAVVGGLLYSNSNYIFSSGCQDLLGLTVIFDVTADIMTDSGFTVQFNANSASGATVDAFQQYGFSVSGGSISGFINNWQNVSTQVVCDYTGLCSTPLNNGLPAGYRLVLGLLNDGAGNVIGANFQVFDSFGSNIANSDFLVQNAGCNCGGTCLGFKQGDLAPITAFSIDVVGPGNGAGTTFASGAGSITYSLLQGTLTPQSFTPACVATVLGTAETSNVSYGPLFDCPMGSISQPFSVLPRTCTTTNGPCTGAGGSGKCITVAGVTQCCHSNWLWGWFPWIRACTDGQIENQGCGGPCY